MTSLPSPPPPPAVAPAGSALGRRSGVPPRVCERGTRFRQRGAPTHISLRAVSRALGGGVIPYNRGLAPKRGGGGAPPEATRDGWGGLPWETLLQRGLRPGSA